MVRRASSYLLVAVLALTLLATMAGAGAAPTLPDLPKPGVDTSAPDIGKYGGTFVTSTFSDPRTFNPIVSQDTVSSTVVEGITSGLVDQNYLTGEIEPALAESWTVSRDGRTWTFTLRDKLVWSDGQPLTVDDVVFTLEAIFTPGVDGSLRDPLTFRGQRVQWRKLDGRRIQFQTPRDQPPVGLFLRLIEDVPIVPKHKLADALQKGGAEFSRTWGLNANARDMVSSGPFIFQSYTPGQRFILVRNPRYWKVDRNGQRLPYLTRYILQILPNQEASRLRFLAKETDAYEARPAEFAQLKQQEQQGNFTVYDGPETFSRTFLVFNQNPAAVKPPKLAWFQDARFRRALTHAIDQNAIIQQVYAGRATLPTSEITVGNKLYYNANLRPYPYGIERAQQLLAEAGYRRGSDGFLRDAQGNVVEFTMITNAGNVDREAIGNLVRQDFTKLGIRVSFVPESFPSLVGKLTGTYNWEAIIIGFTGSLEPGTDSRNVWLSSGDLHMWWPKQEKPATQWEAEIDRIFEQLPAELDQAKRKQMYFRFQEIVYENLPMLYFPYVKTQPAVRNTIGNVKLGLQGHTPGLPGWSVPATTTYFKGAYRP
jgi:peptide/nickel transport system substrate-binding protein